MIVCPTVLLDASFACLNYAAPDYIERGREALRLTGLSDKEDSYIWQLSGGQKHLLALAGAVSLCPDVLILDEPAAQLDPAHARMIYDVLRDLNGNHGKTVVVIEHHTEYIARYTKNAALICGGGLLWKLPSREALGRVDELMANSIFPPEVTLAARALRSRRLLADGDRDSVFGDKELLAESGVRPPEIAELAGLLLGEACYTVDDFVNRLAMEERGVCRHFRRRCRGLRCRLALYPTLGAETMTIDLHTHGKLARKLPYSREYVSRLFGEASAAGLDAICLTEHFNTEGFRPLYDALCDGAFPRDGDCFLAPGLRIFTGMEVDIAEGGHVLAIGAIEDIFALYDRLADHREKGSFLPAAELLPLFGEYPVMVVAAHPFREGGHIPELPDEVLAGFDFIELNGKDVAARREDVEARTYSLAGRLHLPVAAGSDTHQALQFGCICNRLPGECSTVPKLRELLLEGAPVIADTCADQVRAASLLKRALKEIDALGGDYLVVVRE